jgi:Tfp pilus assembly protein PilF
MTRLLLIGAAGMDWPGFDAVTRSGEAPRMAALRERGIAGWLSGGPPSPGPAAWTTLVTGLQPEVHGVWRDQEEWPGGIRASGRRSWRAPPLWARLESAGVSTGSVAWPAITPGDSWAGAHLDDDFPETTGRSAEDWALPPHCAPTGVREAVRNCRVHPSQITGDMLRPLAPDLAARDPASDRVLPALAIGMARAATVQAAALRMLGGADVPAPDAVFVHHRWLGRVRGGFQALRETGFAEAIPAAWRFLDGLVGRLAERAGPETLVMVVSPGSISAPGVVLAVGAGVAPDADFGGASLLDITPTILARFGLEDASLAGRRLELIGGGAPLASAPSPRLERAPLPDPRILHAVRAQGYRPPPRPSPVWRAQGFAELALMMLERDPAGAADMARTALTHDPANVLALRVEVRAHVALDQAEPLPSLGEQLLRVAPDRGWGPLAHGAYHVMRREIRLASPWLARAEADADVGTLLTVAAVWIAAGRQAKAARVFEKVLTLDRRNVSAEIGLAMVATARRDFMAAETGLNRARRIDPGRPAIYLQLAQTYARSGRKVEAARAAAFAARLGAPEVLAAAARAGKLRG